MSRRPRQWRAPKQATLSPAREADTAAVTVPAGVEEVVLLGDGDSDRFATEQVLQRAAKRIALTAPDVRTVRIAWADDGADFNDMLRGAA